MEIKVVKKALAAGEAVADEIRGKLAENDVYMVTFMGSPGSGKTAVIERLLETGLDGFRAAVVEGDIATTADAERLARFDIPIVQVNTEPFGGDCHMPPNLLSSGLEDLDLSTLDLVIVENVGNLVCPAEFDIGENLKVVVLSIAEGEDKPLKYPLIFRESGLCVVSKSDLAGALDFDIDRLRTNISRVNGTIPVIETSARTETGIDELEGFLIARIRET
ncbi:MAG: hydrogenase nickel incorporation protein HypB [Candidatus Coatesbacteria bacterium]|nr:MAG: hydrogenase nickel incorporation protein HypB [Candidatus Coatesbacteria bacterium]